MSITIAVAALSTRLLAGPGDGYSPDTTAPGTGGFMHLINGAAFWVLVACVLGVVAGAASFIFGRNRGYDGAMHGGAYAVGGSLIAALITLNAGGFVNWVTP